MMKNMNGVLYIIPSPLNESLNDFYTSEQKKRVHHIQNFVVENKKPARKSLKKLNLKTELQNLVIFENNKNCHLNHSEIIDILVTGSDVGLISDCGLPGVADPGSEIVLKCHLNSILVKTIAQESSILSSLACSGFNGQNFEFIGYLPIDKNERKRVLNSLALKVKQCKKTFIFIETPHRNHGTFQFLLDSLNSEIRLCVAYDMNGDEEYIRTKTINSWQKCEVILGKKPCIFLIN